MEQRLSLITLGVEDLRRSIAFYEALGWRRSARNADGVAFFQLGGMVLSLFPREALADDAGVAPFGEGFRGIALSHNVRDRADVDILTLEISAAGGTVVKEPEAKSWGGYGAYVADPDGFLWEIAWNPGFPMAEDGSIRLPE